MTTTTLHSENQLLKLDVPALVGLAGVGRRSMATGKPWTKKPLIAIIMRDQGNATARVLANLPPEPVAPPALKLVAAPADDDESGYDEDDYDEVPQPNKGRQLLKRRAGDGAKWLTRCNTHGTVTTADSGAEAHRLGLRANRGTWCQGCAK